MKPLIYFHNHKNLETVNLFSQEERTSDITEATVHVSLGGDGAFLHMVSDVVNKESITNVADLDFVGFNFGHLGFLACSRELGVFNTLKAFKKNYCIKKVKRMLLTVESSYGMYKRTFLNEVVFKPEQSKLYEVGVLIDGSRINYQGDGLIISTPTGSTAYNLSAGGPILFPNMKSMVLTPICPFTLADRPLVINNEIKVLITEPTIMVIDGTELIVNSGDIMKIKFGKSITTYIDDTYTHLIQKKLYWNRNLK